VNCPQIQTKTRRATAEHVGGPLGTGKQVAKTRWLERCYRGQRPERADKKKPPRCRYGSARPRGGGPRPGPRSSGSWTAACATRGSRTAASGAPQISLPQCAVNIAPEVLGSACISRPSHVLLIQQNLAASAPYSQSRKSPAGSLLIQRLTRLGRRPPPLNPAHARRGRWEGPCQFSPAAAAFMVRSASRRETRATQRPTSYGPLRRFFVSDRGRLCGRRCPTIRCTIWHETAP